MTGGVKQYRKKDERKEWAAEKTAGKEDKREG